MSPRSEMVARFLTRIADEFPELAGVLRAKSECATYSPPPLDFVAVARPRAASSPEVDAAIASDPDAVDKPALVNPRHVKY